MSKRYIVIMYIMAVVCAQAQNTCTSATAMPITFNEGVDMMAMIWRLAGDRTYNRSMITDYNKQADAYFAAYKEHPAVVKAREYAHSGLGYDAVASYGLHLSISPEGNIRFNERMAGSGDRSFSRWSVQQQEDMLALVEDFYNKTDFHRWYMSTVPVQNEAIQAFMKVAEQLDMSWLNQFFGPKTAGTQFQIVLSILCGVNNYGCSMPLAGGGELLSPVISCCMEDTDGHLYYNPEVVLPVVVHEFCHAYCNPLDARYWKRMRKNATIIFELQKEKLIPMAYTTPEIMLDETFVRSCVIRYQLAHNTALSKNKLLAEPVNMGFVLSSYITETLEQYEQQRNKYATMKDFMPVYVKTVNAYPAKKMAKAMAKAAKNNATYICNIKDGDTNVPSGEFDLVITFSKPMQPSISLGYGRENGPFIPLAYGMSSVSWDDSGTVLTVTLDLEPYTTYSFSILGQNYKTTDGNTAGNTLNIDFTTGE